MNILSLRLSCNKNYNKRLTGAAKDCQRGANVFVADYLR